MKLLTLDPATETGWTYGDAGAFPRVGVERLKPKDLKRNGISGYQALDIAGDKLFDFVEALLFIDRDAPDLVVIEAPLANFQRDNGEESGFGGNDISSVQGHVLYRAVRDVCRTHQVDLEVVSASTWRKHFVGRGTFPRKDFPEGYAKKVTIQQCHDTGYLPKTCRNDNQADACGLFDYASNIFAKKPVVPFRLTGPVVLRHG